MDHAVTISRLHPVQSVVLQDGDTITVTLTESTPRPFASAYYKLGTSPGMTHVKNQSFFGMSGFNDGPYVNGFNHDFYFQAPIRQGSLPLLSSRFLPFSGKICADTYKPREPVTKPTTFSIILKEWRVDTIMEEHQ